MEYNVDLHIHGPHAGGTSKNMSVEKTAEMGYYKGLQLNPIGDLTHKGWFDRVFSSLKEEDECFYHETTTIFGKKKSYFILSTEVQVKGRVHNLVLFPDKKSILDFREQIKPFTNHLDGVRDGRPWLQFNSEKFAKICVDLNLLFGPAHAFTPYFSLYGHNDSIKDTYGQYADDIAFLELGLSADAYSANDIEELKDITFVSNGDAHSFWPHKLGREFNRFKLEKPNFYELEKAFKNKDGRELIFNVGLDPKEGQYTLTACNRCYQHYKLNYAIANNYRCSCGGTIKRGVQDRIDELSFGKTRSYNRPQYKHVLPLLEIIAFVLKIKNPLSTVVQKIWWKYIERFDNEINVLLDVSEKELEEFDSEMAKYIISYRNGWVVYRPGGGGQYGTPFICLSEEERIQKQREVDETIYNFPPPKQKTLF
jgi:uncharacterized protein (TIGR00375 family)